MSVVEIRQRAALKGQRGSRKEQEAFLMSTHNICLSEDRRKKKFGYPLPGTAVVGKLPKAESLIKLNCS